MNASTRAAKTKAERPVKGLRRCWRQMPIRWRLTIWYGGSMGLLLIGFSVLVWTMTSGWIQQQLDMELREELAELQQAIDDSTTDESLRDNVGLWSKLHEPHGFEFELRTTEDRLLMRSQLLTAADAELSVVAGRGQEARSVEISGIGRRRVLFVHTTVLGVPRELWISATEDGHRSLLKQLLFALVFAGAIAKICAAVGGYFLSRRALRPVESIAATAASISASQLTGRIVPHNHYDELGQLSHTINSMLDRLDDSFSELKRFTADAAHELRTPLTLLRNELEVCLRKPRTEAEYRAALTRALGDTERICGLSEQLLELSRGDSGQLMTRDDVPIAALLTDVVAHFQPVAIQKDVTVELDDSLRCSIASDDEDSVLTSGVAVSGDCLLLRRLFLNVVDNAVKYTPAGGWVKIEGHSAADEIRITIQDSGRGIAAEHLPHIFERFYRVDNSRATTTGGTGLGLAICRSIAEAHGGTISLSSVVGSGTQVTICLPAKMLAENH